MTLDSEGAHRALEIVILVWLIFLQVRRHLGIFYFQRVFGTLRVSLPPTVMDRRAAPQRMLFFPPFYPLSG